MERTAKEWATITNAFNPIDPVPAEHLKDWYVDRPDGVLQDLFVRIHPEKLPQRMLVIGHRSSGKSTELVHLAEDARRYYNHLVVRVDINQNADIASVNPLEVLVLMGTAVFKVARSELKKECQPDRAFHKAMVDALNTVVTTCTQGKPDEGMADELLAGVVAFGASALAGPLVGAVAETAIRISRPFSFKSGTDIEMVKSREVQPRVVEMVRQMNALIDEVQAKSSRSLLLIVDGLDRLPPANVGAFFTDTKYLTDPVCRVIYAAPIMLRYDQRFEGARQQFNWIAQLPNVKLHPRGNPGKRDRKAFAMMREVVDRRLKSLQLEPRDVISVTALNLLIKGSGGLLRNLVRLFQNAAMDAQVAGQAAVDMRIARRVLSAERREMQAMLTTAGQAEMEAVVTSQRLSGSDLCDELVYANFILSYINDDIWYDCHPLLRDEEKQRSK